MEFSTPMMRQYNGIKSIHMDAILFYRLGDFYEVFNEDAKIASKELEITLTSRKKGEDGNVPMAGVPYHAANGYIKRLINKGYRVAICEQMEDPRFAKGIVKREVIRVITPGTVLEDAMLEGKENNYVVAVDAKGSGAKDGIAKDGVLGFAILDITTGDFRITQVGSQKELISELSRVNPAECVVRKGLKQNNAVYSVLKGIDGMIITEVEDWTFETGNAYRILTEHFGVTSLEGYGCENMPVAYSSAGGLLQYAKETQKGNLPHIVNMTTYFIDKFLMIDNATQRNLELFSSMYDGTVRNTLLWVMDYTITNTGGRLLKNWLVQPLSDKDGILKRSGAVEEFLAEKSTRSKIRTGLSEIGDFERMLARTGCGNASPRDMVGLGKSLKKIPAIKEIIKSMKAEYITEINGKMHDLVDLYELIEKAVSEDPPNGFDDGGVIKRGYNAELDEVIGAARDGMKWITELERKERLATGINNLKVRYNKVFGYYIEITKTHVESVPSYYMRKQTLVNCERYETQELKEKESLIMNAKEKMVEIEKKLFSEICGEVITKAKEIQDIAGGVALIDVLSGLAELAEKRKYSKPEITDSDEIFIKDGRHPVVEVVNMGEKFVPNDAALDTRENQIIVITGPNMAGKSTYIRQVALIALMAHAGSYVPASECRMGVLDRIFTRIGASDNLAKGQSTFMLEMNEAANILNNATSKGLIILDEIGRGTSTFDGLSIAWAVAEHVHNKLFSKTLFATHYHELTELEKILPRVKNYNIAVREWNDEVIFLRKIIPGGTDKSYGIQVARLAGLPKEVIQRAKELLLTLEEGEYMPDGLPKLAKEKSKPNAQLSFFGWENLELVNKLKGMDIDNMTPLQALNALKELRESVKEF